jgi:Tfp pilus assembly protein FimV
MVVAAPRPAVRVVPRRAVSAGVAVARVVRPDGRRARPGERVHVVLAGESLWSIASDLLGGRPTVARVAREVNRLWDLNRARIGTGDRDLLPTGTRLELQ